jgi:hypothetical protein
MEKENNKMVEETEIVKTNKGGERRWQGLCLEDPAWPVEKCLKKVTDAFSKLTMLANVRDLIISYRAYAEENDLDFNNETYYEEMVLTSETVFTIRCYCGLCHFTIEYNFESDPDDEEEGIPSEVYGFTLRNESTGQEVFVQNTHDYTDQEFGIINDKIFEIID